MAEFTHEQIADLVKTRFRFPSVPADRAATQIEALKLVLLQRQTIALERIAEHMTPAFVVTVPDQAALFPEIQP